MSNLTLKEAFSEYGAKLVNPQWAVSAIAANGSLVVSCWAHYFKKIDNSMRYEDTLSRWSRNAAGNNLLKEHIKDSVKNNRVVRLVITKTEDALAVDLGNSASTLKKEFYTKPEMIGRITYFDGNKFIIEFRSNHEY